MLAFVVEVVVVVLTTVKSWLVVLVGVDVVAGVVDVACVVDVGVDVALPASSTCRPYQPSAMASTISTASTSTPTTVLSFPFFLLDIPYQPFTLLRLPYKSLCSTCKLINATASVGEGLT